LDCSTGWILTVAISNILSTIRSSRGWFVIAFYLMKKSTWVEQHSIIWDQINSNRYPHSFYLELHAMPKHWSKWNYDRVDFSQFSFKLISLVDPKISKNADLYFSFSVGAMVSKNLDTFCYMHATIFCYSLSLLVQIVYFSSRQLVTFLFFLKKKPR
jgi:hypothetical protein